ncbi:Hsp20 family protein [Pendulispora brunnea]|uniref:Hsp20 family protein n=1 Tax=Pendulispora brunnea TaxID=2905690 RepID=A0ABZ2JZ45_9BACT
MADIAIRKENENKPVPGGVWDPFRMMRDLIGWDPFREIAPLYPPVQAGYLPTFEVKETKDSYVFKADVPGMKESDLDISLTGNRLTVAGKREAEKREQGETYYTYERSYGSFTRSFTLPDGVDTNAVHADLREGVLTLSVRKTPEAQPKRITIQSGVKKS